MQDKNKVKIILRVVATALLVAGIVLTVISFSIPMNSKNWFASSALSGVGGMFLIFFSIVMFVVSKVGDIQKSSMSKMQNIFTKNKEFFEQFTQNTFENNSNTENYCEYCGSKIKQGSNVCDSCGASLKNKE